MSPIECPGGSFGGPGPPNVTKKVHLKSDQFLGALLEARGPAHWHRMGTQGHQFVPKWDPRKAHVDHFLMKMIIHLCIYFVVDSLAPIWVPIWGLLGAWPLKVAA